MVILDCLPHSSMENSAESPPRSRNVTPRCALLLLFEANPCCKDSLLKPAQSVTGCYLMPHNTGAQSWKDHLTLLDSVKRNVPYRPACGLAIDAGFGIKARACDSPRSSDSEFSGLAELGPTQKVRDGEAGQIKLQVCSKCGNLRKHHLLASSSSLLYRPLFSPAKQHLCSSMLGTGFDVRMLQTLFGRGLKEAYANWVVSNDFKQNGMVFLQQLPHYGTRIIHRPGAGTNSAHIFVIPLSLNFAYVNRHFLIISRLCFQYHWAQPTSASKIYRRYALFQKRTHHRQSHSHLMKHLNLICRTMTFWPEAMSTDGVMGDNIVDGTADPNRKRPRVNGEESEEEIEGGEKMDEDGKPLEGADGETRTPSSKAPAHLEQGMRNLLSSGAQTIHDKREALRAELAQVDEEERQRKLSKQPGLVGAAGGAHEGGPSEVNQGNRGRAANARVFGPHVPLLSTTCPSASSVAALQATNWALKSAVHSARGAPRKIGSVVLDLLSRVRDVATTATVHPFSKTLGLRTDYARGLQCKKIFSMECKGVSRRQKWPPLWR
jgi:hypothetical protein